jgi:hypothetical protein
MKIPTGALLPFGPWLAPKAALSGARDMTYASALSVIHAAGPAATCEWFKQPIDHNNVSLGTWSQLYCVNPQWWTPGAPVKLSVLLELVIDR